MGMRVEGEGSIPALRTEIWDVMFDPAFMSQVVPGCKEIVKTQEDEYKVRMVLGIPAVQGQYSGTLRILEKNPHDRIKGSIEGEGGLGKINGIWETEFEQSENSETRIIYSVDVEISGPMASMVGGFMEQVAISLTKQGLKKFSEAITRAKQDTTAFPSEKASAPSDQSMITVIFKAIFEALFKKIFGFFKSKEKKL